jgi:hypothetical protein
VFRRILPDLMRAFDSPLIRKAHCCSAKLAALPRRTCSGSRDARRRLGFQERLSSCASPRRRQGGIRSNRSRSGQTAWLASRRFGKRDSPPSRLRYCGHPLPGSRPKAGSLSLNSPENRALAQDIRWVNGPPGESLCLAEGEANGEPNVRQLEPDGQLAPQAQWPPRGLVTAA